MVAVFMSQVYCNCNSRRPTLFACEAMHIHCHDHAPVDKMVGLETVDHPTDGQVVAYFGRRMRNSCSGPIEK